LRIGITGWRGFIGSHLKDKIDSPILFQGDMREIKDVKRFVKECDRIYHIAGKNRDEEGVILANNIVSTGNLYVACKTQMLSPQIIFVSSTQTEWRADCEYGLTKLIEESIVDMFDKWCIYRVPNVYGPKCQPDYNSVVATFSYQLAHGKQPRINNPLETREFIFVDDIISELLHPKFNGYLRPKGEKMTIQEVYDYLTVKLGKHEKLGKTLNWYRENL
jgi:UDP-2-acetamido-2,6-beta-L-arabino-hexul-4-ose reductase